MSDVKLFRLSTNDEGTIGVIVFDNQYLYTGEPPWRGNKQNISCIPAGVYTVFLHISKKYGNVFKISGVPGRSYILFHEGNFFGDRASGYRTNTQGCILLGCKRGKLSNQRAVLSSRTARARFERIMNFKTFTLEIYDGFTRTTG